LAIADCRLLVRQKRKSFNWQLHSAMSVAHSAPVQSRHDHRARP
jgi:hypothetical protein